MTIENKFKWILRTLCLAWLVSLTPFVSYADQPESIEYIVRCDRQRQQLTVAESSFVPAIDIEGSQKGVSEFTVNPDTLTKIGGTDMQPLRLPAGQKAYDCRLGKSLYRVVVEPYIFNARVMGECGAAEPVISLSVSRNGKRLFSQLDFGNCYTNRTIHRVQVSETTSSIKVLALLDPHSLPIGVERTFPLTSVPKEWERAIFEDYPTGDVDADLFIAVYKRDIAAIRQALQRGANPNATDVNGFPPLALLGNGRQAAYRDRRLEEYDRLSENIAKILFTAGASGKGTNSNGVTLLYYLIGEVPASVIDMILTNGGRADEGDLVQKAVTHADVNLVKKLIDKGADPNKKGQGRTTPLWTASTWGFYSYPGSDKPQIADYVRCARLLLERGAKIQDAVPDKEGLLCSLVRGYGKDERIKMILSELIPYTDQDEIDRAQKLAAKIASGNQAYASLAQWLKEYIR